ncbi:unnamed protein product [Vitrella brassicaformis CCMP3155]|nr:unnamed protein product [Vitrella brassicaformis CCMP3155]|eukprot:CEM23368.1 unnamed protein product [Vitrella brassicaformis CCMP3155]
MGSNGSSGDDESSSDSEEDKRGRRPAKRRDKAAKAGAAAGGGLLSGATTDKKERRRKRKQRGEGDEGEGRKGDMMALQKTSLYGHNLGTEGLDEGEVQRQMKRMRQEQQDVDVDERRRSYHSIAGTNALGTVTAEEMEAYSRSRVHADDPMKAFLK